MFVCENPQQLVVKLQVKGQHKICKSSTSLKIKFGFRCMQVYTYIVGFPTHTHTHTGRLPKDIHTAAKLSCRPSLQY